MLNEIFYERYADVPMWDLVTSNEIKLLSQCFRIVEEQLLPYYIDGYTNDQLKASWKDLHDALSRELGVESLSKIAYWYPANSSNGGSPISGVNPMNKVCKTFVCSEYDNSVEADIFVKQRLSFIELAFRKKFMETEKQREAYESSQRNREFVESVLYPSEQKKPRPKDFAMYIGPKFSWEKFQVAVEELNARLRQSKSGLHYHSGYIQISADSLLEERVEEPFWNVLSYPEHRNIDTDMKEAIDRRDSGDRDPAFYAARALESTIKIISDRNGWSRGTEKGAANYIDNLQSSKNGAFIESWEADAMREFFRKIRNPLGHGPGPEKMPVLTKQQTDWAIESCMSWIKSLLGR